MAEPAAVPGVDPSKVNTPDELAACLDGLRRRRGLSYEVMEKAAAKLPSRSGRSRLEPLPKSTVGEIVTGKRLPAKGKLLTFLTVCEVAPADLAQWLAAWERASTADLARPAGGVRTRDARPQLLGVHAAISVPGMPDDLPPEYVSRDADDGEFGVRVKVAAAAQRGGFVLLVGGSSVGKTRCAVEAVRTLLPDWWLVHPAGPAEVNALAQAPSPRTVVWLDELQRYLDGEHGLTGAVVRALLIASHPVVIIGTLWPDRYAAYTVVPAPGAADPNAREREVLDLAAVIRVDPDFSPAEQDRARAAAARDRRLAVALETGGYGLTQTLAAAPQLIARWQDAKTTDPYAWAVLTAALDVARLGARAPLSPDLLRAAAPGYCTSQQQAEAPENWFEQALAYATGKLHGAAAALSPAGAGMGQLAGYTVADYLIQHASRERRYARLPASTWDSILSYIRDPAEATRLADSARSRLLYGCAIPMYRCAAEAGDRYPAKALVDLLERRGDPDEILQALRPLADAGDPKAAKRLAGLLAQRGDLDELRARAGADVVLGGYAAMKLADLLKERGDLDELRARADAGDLSAAVRLAYLLGERGDLDELRARTDAGDEHAAVPLAGLLVQRGDPDEAMQVLRAPADAGNEHAAMRLAGMLEDRGDLDQAAQVLRGPADAGDWSAAVKLAELLAKRGDLDELGVRADVGDDRSAWQLADLLKKRADLDELRARADAGDHHAVVQLVELLAERGDLDELDARADAGDHHAAAQLARLPEQPGELDELRARADAGDHAAAMRLAGLLAERGDLEQLRARTDAGDEHAAMRLAGLLEQRGDLDQAAQVLRARADAGDPIVAMSAGVSLADLLVKRGDLDELRARTDAGDEYAAFRLADLLAEQGRGEEAERLRRFGLNPDGSIAST
jgi:thioredoxin-like negative regulator of GroEL